MYIRERVTSHPVPPSELVCRLWERLSDKLKVSAPVKLNVKEEGVDIKLGAQVINLKVV